MPYFLRGLLVVLAFVVTRINREQCVATGIVTRIIRQVL